MAFNPKKHMSQIKNKDYLEVKWRIAWMRDEHPLWGIDTIPMQIGECLVVKAIVFNEDGGQIASGLATVRAASSNRESWAGREFEKAETAALGRALAVAGYGTQFTDDFDEGEYLSDSPVQRQQQPSKQQPNTSRNDDIPEGTKKDVHIIARETKADKNGNPMLVFTALTGERIYLFSRGIFKAKSYCTGNDWTTIGEKATMKLNCRVKKVGGYWEFIPETIPEFDPDFDDLGKMKAGDPDDVKL
jgi:hypothetical protein